MRDRVLKKFASLLAELGLAGAFVFGEANVAYLTGYKGPGALYVDASSGFATLYVPPLEAWRAESSVEVKVEVVAFGKISQALSAEVFGRVDEREIHEIFAAAAKQSEGRRVGADLSNAPKDVVAAAHTHLKDFVVDLTKELLQMRSVKMSFELELLKEAVHRSEAALASVLEKLRGSETVGEVKAELAKEAYLRGLEGLAFDPIVAVGPATAFPHAPTDPLQKLTESPHVLVDFGGVYKLYCADITRTATFAGHASRSEVEKLLEAVAGAYEEALSAIFEGAAAKDVDAKARRYLERLGLGKWFVHGLGHGVGVEVHESPRLAPTSEDVLRSGMVVTVEPGVYVKGKLGVRVENVVLVEKSGARPLNKLELLLTL